MMHFKGKYKINIPLMGMFINKKITVFNDNIVTLLGESFFLNRAINDELNPIQYICLGNNSNRARKKDISLGNEIIRKKCIKTVDLDKKRIQLTASFQAKEISGTREIGVSNGDILITHDVYNESVDDLLTATTGEITIDYFIELSSGAIRSTEWAPVSGKDNTYYLVEPNNVVEVIENNTGSGYSRIRPMATLSGTLKEVDDTKSSFYYDTNSKNLYIHTSDNLPPSTKEIIVFTR